MVGIVQSLMSKDPTKEQQLTINEDSDLPGATSTTVKTMSAPAAPAGGYAPEKITLDASETVEGRVASIAGKDSALNTLARANATKTMNKRGLINSSMNVGAGEKAVLETATPIAMADSQNSLTVKQSNQNAQNQMLSQKLTGDQNIQQIEKQGQVNSDLNFQNFTYETNLQKLRGDQATALSEIETRASQIGQATQSMALMSSSFNTAIGEILANPDMTPEIKQQHINKQIELYRAQVNLMGNMSNLPLAQYFDFGIAGGTGAPPGGTTTTPTTPKPVNPSDGTPVGFQSFVSEHLKAAGGQPNETVIKAALDEAVRTAMDADKVFTVLRPLYPGVPQSDFEMEVTNRGYQISNGKITKTQQPGETQPAGNTGGTGGTAGNGQTPPAPGGNAQDFNAFAASTLGQGTAEQNITSVLNKAREAGVSAQGIYSAMSPYFPGVTYEQFLNELSTRGYYDLLGGEF